MTGLLKRGRGRKSAAAEVAYTKELEAFCEDIRQINSTLDFRVSSRGWCYILEDRIGLAKGDFDSAQELINDCRKSGLLPLDICAQDGSRAADGIEVLDRLAPRQEAEAWIETLKSAHQRYTPFSFWKDKEYYCEMWVEKIDLKSLFAFTCSSFNIPITNVKGWNDINSRAAAMRRFREWEDRGNQCVLLYCGDHHPGGLAISSQIMSNLADLSEAVDWYPTNLIIDRFGLNYDFIEVNNLSWIDNLETSSGGRLDDPRHKDHFKPYVQDYIKKFGARKVEANALVVRPQQGRDLCRQAIRKYVPHDALNDYRKALAVERRKVKIEIAHLLQQESGE